MEIAIDTGNKQVKTDHSISISGVVPQNTIPATARPEDYIRYRGRYYTLTNKRQEYLRDKSETERYFVLAMMGIAKELDYKENHNEITYDPDKTYYITMLGGLPTAHMEDARLKDNFKAYFKTSDAQYVWYKGRTWRVKITKVYVYAQCYAAIMTVFTQIKPYARVVGIDIGGFTTDYLTMVRGTIDIEHTDSLEQGLTLLYQTIHKKCLKKFDAIIEESDVDAILSGDTSLYDEEIITLVEEEAQAFVDSLLSSFREFQIDLKHSFVVFLGGGAILLKKYIEKSPLLGRYMFLEDIKGNVHGYKLLYQVMQKKKGEQS